MSYIQCPVTTKADIDKKIEIEAANLMYFNFKNKENAFKEAKAYVEFKYKEIIEEIKAQGQY